MEALNLERLFPHVLPFLLLLFASGRLHIQAQVQSRLPTAAEALELSRQAFLTRPPYALRISLNRENTVLREGSPPQATKTIPYEVDMRRDGSKLDIIHHQVRSDGSIGYARTILNSHGYFTGFSAETSDFLSIEQWSKHSALAYLDAAIVGLEDDGILTGDVRPFYEILGMEGSTLSDEVIAEEIEGHFTAKIEAETQFGHYRIWFDPEHGWLPRKIVVERGPDHIFDPQNTIRAPDNDRLKGKPKQHVEYLAREIRKEDGHFYPVIYRLTADYLELEDGLRHIVIQERHVVDGPDWNPDFEALGAFDFQPKPKTRVLVEGFQGIKYAWKEGKPVAEVDQRLIQSLEESLDELRSLDGGIPSVDGLVPGDIAVSAEARQPFRQDSTRSIAELEGPRFHWGIAFFSSCGIAVFFMTILWRQRR